MKLCVRAGKQQPGLSGGGKWKERGEKTRRRWRAAPRRAPLSSAQVQIRELWHDKESWQSSLSLFISKRTSLETEIRLITNHTSPSSFFLFLFLLKRYVPQPAAPLWLLAKLFLAVLRGFSLLCAIWKHYEICHLDYTNQITTRVHCAPPAPHI